MGFATLEEAQSAYDELKPEFDALEGEKASLLRKRDELLGEVKTLKTKFVKFADYADQDIDIAALLDIKGKFEAGDSDLKTKYEQAYQADKQKFEQRLKAIEDERQIEKQQREQEQQENIAAKLKADAITEFSKESYRIRNSEQFWRLFGEAKIQRDESGKLYIGNEYKQLSDYIAQINEDSDNAHHFKPKGGSGSGTGAGSGSSGKATENPWKRESFNLTRQGQIMKSNPELAARLKAEAGVK